MKTASCVAGRHRCDGFARTPDKAVTCACNCHDSGGSVAATTSPSTSPTTQQEKARRA